MENIWDKIVFYIMQYGLNFIYAIMIVIIGKWVAGLIARLSVVMLRKYKLSETLTSFLKNIIYYIIILFALISALDKVGIQTATFVTVMGAAGLAVGLALQGALSNFAAGVMLVFFQPFAVGDNIESTGASGIVKEIQIFSTVLETSDNKKVIIPNSKITSDKIIVTQNKQ